MGGSITAGIDQLAWLGGRWTGQHGADAIEETWNPPADGAMMGMFRAVRDGHPRFYELLALDSEDSALVFRFRHFGRDLAAWEDRADPLVLDLVTITDREAVFQRRGAERRMTYRHEEPDGLLVFFETPGAARDPADEFRFIRA